MFGATINFTALLSLALIVGAMFAVSLIFDPVGIDASTYVSQQQLAVRKLNTILPLLGALSVISVTAAALLARDDKVRAILLIATIMFIVAAGLITRFGNQPINVIIMSWQPNAVPAAWTEFRDQWWRWHMLRFCCGLIALALMIVATLVR